MKSLTGVLGTVLIVLIIAGCGSAANRSQVKSRGERAGVFTEIDAAEAHQKGFVALIVKADLKTHLDGYYILESKESRHGKQGYPFIISIDGQAVEWKVDGVRDARPAYDKTGETSRDPEAREGIKYNIEKKLRLAAGPHRIYFGLPEEKYSLEVEVTLTEEQENILEFRPIYRYKTSPTRIPTFAKGINEY